MNASRTRYWRQAATVLAVLGGASGSITALALQQPLTGLAAGAGCLVIARFLYRTHPAPTSAERLEIGPDNGDLMEWMGERFIWQPGDLDEPGEGER